MSYNYTGFFAECFKQLTDTALKWAFSSYEVVGHLGRYI